MAQPTNPLLRILLDPRTVFASIFLGVIFGIYFKPMALALHPLGESFMALLSMAIFPFICSIIVVGLAKIVRNPAMLSKFSKLIIIFVISMLLSAVLGIAATFMFKSNITFSKTAQTLLAKEINPVEEYSAEKPKAAAAVTTAVVPTPAVGEATVAKPSEASKLEYFLKQITPKNVFAALNEGLTMKVIVVLLLVGIALGSIKNEESDYVLHFLESVAAVFNRIFHWMLYLLPLGLFCLFAATSAVFDAHMFSAFMTIIFLIFTVGLLLVILFNSVICYKLDMSFFKPFVLMKKPILLAFTTMSSTVAVPQSVEILSGLSLESDAVNLTVPLGISINRQGNVFILGIVSMITMLFYQIPLDAGSFVILVFVVGALGSFAFGGGALLIPVFIIIAKVMGMPSPVGIALLTTTDVFVFWINILVTLHANYAASVLVAKKDGRDVLVRETD